MKLSQLLPALTLLTSLTHAIVLPQQYPAEPPQNLTTSVVVKVFLSSQTSLEDLAKELGVDFPCLQTANPSSNSLRPGESCIVPRSCCGTNCKGKFCSQLPGCVIGLPTAAPPQYGASTSYISTITTSVPSPISGKPTPSGYGYGGSAVAGWNSSMPSSSGYVPAVSTTSIVQSPSTVVPATSSGNGGQNGTLAPSSGSSSSETTSIPILSTSSLASGVPSGSSSSSASTLLPGTNSTNAIPPSGTGVPTTQSLSSTSQSLPSNATTTTTTSSAGISASSSTNSNASISQTTTTAINSSGSSSTTLQNFSSIIITTTNSAGEVFTTFQSPSPSSSSSSSAAASSSVITTTNSAGETIISTFQPSSSIITTTNSAGETIISTFQPSGIVTTALQPSSSIITTTNSAGETVTSVIPSSIIPSSTSPSSTIASSTLTTSNSVGETVTSSPPPSSSPSSSILTLTNSDGTETTITQGTPSSSSSSSTSSTTQTTTSADASITSQPLSSPPITSPPPSSSTSSEVAGGIIFPVTTPVPEPKGTDEGSVIPCNIWFFNICINWFDINISGWSFNLPQGIHPPGPPPAITFPPSLSITTNIIGNLPHWPSITVGPDNVPTPEPEPENCETESAELCMTRTSFAVSSTVTTSTQVLSTCATIYGCKVSDSATTTSTTSTCSTCATCYSWPYDQGWEFDDNDPDASDPIAVGPEPARRMMPRDVPAMITPAPVNPLHKRRPDGRSSTNFGTCTFDDIAIMTMEDYPDISDLPSYPAASSYFVISKRSTDAAGTCYAGRIYSTSDIAGVSAAAGEPAYATSGRWPTPVINMDHVYENSLLGSFFEYALGLPGAPSCDQFKSYFVESGRLQKVFKELANVNHPDFAAMDRFVNKMKANLFHVNGGLPNVGVGRFNAAMDNLQGYALVASFLNMPEIISLFRSTHERIYQALGEWDQDVGRCNQDGLSDTWAATYSGWMTSFLSSRADYLTGSASAWYQALTDGGAAAPVFTHLQSSYPVASFSVPVNAMASGLTPAPTQGLVPRQAACTLTASQTSAESSSPTSSIAPPTDLPTLTQTTAFPTPSGSSCASTTTFNQCNGSGNQNVCITTSSCASWQATDLPTTTETPTPTSSTPTSTTYEAPLYTSDVVCNKESDFPGHADISSSAQSNLAKDFCNSHNTNFYPGPPGPGLTETLQDGDDINYRYGISWPDTDCRPEGVDSQNSYSPQGANGITCPILMEAAYSKCDNGGVGGYVEVGCLRYSFDGAL